MNKSTLKAEFINAKIKDAKYIGVSIKTEGSSQPEIIINPRENFDAKFDYYMEACKVYCHIDYDDDMEILELMFDVTMQEMTELIPNFDQYSLTSRQKLLAFISVKELYDNRDKYRSDTKLLASAASSMLLKEIYGGAAQ